jgi:hypothetical protein
MKVELCSYPMLRYFPLVPAEVEFEYLSLGLLSTCSVTAGQPKSNLNVIMLTIL